MGSGPQRHAAAHSVLPRRGLGSRLPPLSQADACLVGGRRIRVRPVGRPARDDHRQHAGHPPVPVLCRRRLVAAPFPRPRPVVAALAAARDPRCVLPRRLLAAEPLPRQHRRHSRPPGPGRDDAGQVISDCSRRRPLALGRCQPTYGLRRSAPRALDRRCRCRDCARRDQADPFGPNDHRVIRTVGRALGRHPPGRGVRTGHPTRDLRRTADALPGRFATGHDTRHRTDLHPRRRSNAPTEATTPVSRDLALEAPDRRLRRVHVRLTHLDGALRNAVACRLSRPSVRCELSDGDRTESGRRGRCPGARPCPVAPELSREPAVPSPAPSR